MGWLISGAVGFSTPQARALLKASILMGFKFRLGISAMLSANLTARNRAFCAIVTMTQAEAGGILKSLATSVWAAPSPGISRAAAPLMLVKSRWSPNRNAALRSAHTSFGRFRLHRLAVKLSQTAEDREDPSACRHRCIRLQVI